MKRLIIQISLAVTEIIMMIPFLAASAIEVNGNEVQLGQTITYEIHASDCPNIIQALDVEVTYDSTALEYIADSIQMPNLTGTLVNDQDKDCVRFNALDLNGFSFKTDSIVATMQFRVISDQSPDLYINSDIKNFIDDELKDHKDEYVYYITLTEDEVKQIETVSEEIIQKSTDNSASSAASETPKNTDNSKVNSNENGTSSLILGTSSAVTESTSDSKTQQQSQTVSVDTLDYPYGNNAHDDTVSAVASKPANYSIVFFAAAGMLTLIAIIAIVFLVTMKNSDKSDETKK